VQRLRHYLFAPLSVAALRLVALAAATDPGTQILIEQPQLLLPLIRAARIPWPDASVAALSSSASALPWLPTPRMHFSAALRLAEPALAALQAVASVFALRRPLLDMGAPPLLLQTAAAGPAWDNTAPFVQKLSATALASVLSRRPAALAKDASNAAATGAPSADEMSSFDLEDLGSAGGTSLESAHVQCLWPLRQAAEEVLRVMCDKSGAIGALDDASAAAAPSALSGLGGDSSSSALASIAEDAANDMSGGRTSSVADGSPASAAASPLRKNTMSVGQVKSNAFHNAAMSIVASNAASRLSHAGSGSFAIYAAERSVRGAPPLGIHLQVRLARGVRGRCFCSSLNSAFSSIAGDYRHCQCDSESHHPRSISYVVPFRA
jgi:hypothetical protein